MCNPPPALPVLEYQRLERARKVAIGGLRLLGGLTTGIGVLLVVQAVGGENWEELSRDFFGALVPAAICGGVLALGIVKLLCAEVIARGSRRMAWVALVIVAVESMAVLLGVIDMVISLVREGYDSIYLRGLVGLLACLVLTGWLAVDYEIVQVLRLEGKPMVLPPAR